VASLGRVVAQTRTARSILEQRGVYPARTAGSQAPAAIDVRAALIAGSSATPHARPAVRQLAFYDRSGTAVHKVFAVDESRSEAWTRSHAAMRTTSSRRASGCRRHASPRVRPDAAIDVPTSERGGPR
jgi:putative heme degradation protein